eukprot:8651-Heterococcus_DN1.PRE.3
MQPLLRKALQGQCSVHMRRCACGQLLTHCLPHFIQRYAHTYCTVVLTIVTGAGAGAGAAAGAVVDAITGESAAVNSTCTWRRAHVTHLDNKYAAAVEDNKSSLD